MRLFIIEFVGIPGAGKTTICRQLDAMRHYQEEDIGLDRTAYIGRYGRNHLPWLERKFVGMLRVIQCLVIQPRISLCLLKFGLACRPISSHKVKCILTALSFMCKLEVDQRGVSREGGVIIIDQGFIQMLGSISVPANKFCLPDCSRLIQAIIPGRINGLVLFDCPLVTGLSRIKRRTHGKSRFDLWSYDGRKDSLLVMKRIFEQAVEAANLVGVPLLRLDSARPAKENSLIVVEWLQKLLREGDSNPSATTRKV